MWEATDVVNMYLLPRYQAVDLNNNLWVRRQTAYIAAHLACMRRGNPSPYEAFVESIERRMEMIRVGRLAVPRMANRDDYSPALSNYTIDDRFGKAKVRVSPGISSGGTSSRQHLAQEYPTDYPGRW